MLEKAKFTMIDESFVCQVCGKKVEKLGYTARDHCPFCLCSLHVDENPGDRNCNCLGILRPIAIEKAKKDQYKIVYICDKCKMQKKNIAAKDDNFDKILEIMSHPVKIKK